MSDLETLLRDSLGHAAEGAPAPLGLVAAARSRARARRRRSVVASVVGVAAVVAPVALLASGGPDTESADPADPVPSPPAASRRTDEWRPDTWRTQNWRAESWHDIEVSVPEDWGYGALAAWCLDSLAVPAPQVERPGIIVPAIGCPAPVEGYGIRFLTAGDLEPVEPVHQVAAGKAYPRGAWVGEVVLGFAGVRVVSPDEWLARRIIGSARVIDDTDHHGCPPRESSPAVDVAPGAGVVSVCRYDLDGWLEQSELLPGRGGSSVLLAIEDAPRRLKGKTCGFPPDRSPVVVLRLDGDEIARVVWDAACPAGNGVFQSGVSRELTSDVMYWVLSPGWSGALDSSVPMPEQLRH